MHNNSSSELGDINFGVPHGSILGPLLFLTYVIDLCNVSQVVQFIISLQITLSKELVIINQWIQSNKLTEYHKDKLYDLFTSS